MPNGEFIDLSLSTDDEAPIKKASRPQIYTQTDSDFDGHSRKRRKLSPPHPSGQKVVEEQQWACIPESDDSLPDERWLREARQVPAQSRSRSEKEMDIAKWRTSITNNDVRERAKTHERIPSPVLFAHRSEHEKNDLSGGNFRATERPTSTAAKKPKIAEEDNMNRARAKEEAKVAAKAIKTREKEEAQERRRLLKEEQAREKQKDKDRAEANKLKLDKKLSTPEMIVDLPLSIDGTSVGTQIKELLQQIGVEVAIYPDLCPNVIKWRRKVDARLNFDTGQREKLSVKEIHHEKHVMCLMAAEEFVELATAGEGDDSQTLDDHVKRIRATCKDCIPIYLIEGLDVWFRKNRIAQNRAYQTAVLGQDNTTKGSNTAAKHKKRKPEVIDEDIIEDALVRLQVVHDCLIHHTAATIETAEWMAHFTEQISQIPYRNEQMARDSNFCMDSGQVKCGKDTEETFINMLLANVRVTAPIAYGIAAKYADVDRLVRGFEAKGPLALEHLKKSANKDGSLADRSIGPAISRRLHKVFMDYDPTSTDV
ncbi:MAG: hypothetical protein Q9220_007358 [cf. Caloplaca sp. 1 TL-2023]